MAYSDFDLTKVRKNFGLQIDEQPDLFADVPAVQPSATLSNILIETAHLAIAINTEKARSEMLITPVLLDIWRQAKNENIKGGLGQCIAEMIAAQIFNEREDTTIETIYGAVTTGEIWKFLKLVGAVVSIDLSDYYIVRDVPKILGILCQGVGLPVFSTVEL